MYLKGLGTDVDERLAFSHYKVHVIFTLTPCLFFYVRI